MEGSFLEHGDGSCKKKWNLLCDMWFRDVYKGDKYALDCSNMTASQGKSDPILAIEYWLQTNSHLHSRNASFWVLPSPLLSCEEMWDSIQILPRWSTKCSSSANPLPPNKQHWPFILHVDHTFSGQDVDIVWRPPRSPPLRCRCLVHKKFPTQDTQEWALRLSPEASGPGLTTAFATIPWAIGDQGWGEATPWGNGWIKFGSLCQCISYLWYLWKERYFSCCQSMLKLLFHKLEMKVALLVDFKNVKIISNHWSDPIMPSS